MFYVPEVGLEPTSLTARDFESRVYTIPPFRRCFYTIRNLMKINQAISLYLYLAFYFLLSDFRL